MSSIPVADISALIGTHDYETRKTAAKCLAESIRLHGCAAIIGHGLAEEYLQDAFTIMNKLFALPLGDKLKAPHPDGAMPHRGYLAASVERSGKLGALHSKSDIEKAFLEKALDWKESYDIGHGENVTQKNVWLPDDVFPGFRKKMIEAFQHLSTISLAILEGLMLGMDLSEEDCTIPRRIHSPVEHQMRLVHYLPFRSEDRQNPQKIRLAPHKHFASYTLLFQGSESGLEFQNRTTGEYMPAMPRKGVLYLNIADLMERYSNGFYPSAMHRVAIPVTEDAGMTVPGRFSIPCFTHIGIDEPVFPCRRG